MYPKSDEAPSSPEDGEIVDEESSDQDEIEVRLMIRVILPHVFNICQVLN